MHALLSLNGAISLGAFALQESSCSYWQKYPQINLGMQNQDFCITAFLKLA